ncbi:MAG: hypothetical protein EBV34_12755 [Betaproteobacteria bacterium]|nr:hypothetical protein [Betaproteobacteria bacterium]NDD15232.1 hypothetical protein [Betaproteobacteria bacterium]
MRGDGTLWGGAGNDTLDGCDRVDTPVFSVLIRTDNVTNKGLTVDWPVTDLVARRNGVDSLGHVEGVQFCDRKLAVSEISDTQAMVSELRITTNQGKF